jgi:dipeptidyl aminopeptidase/acylaminoacyl peptidase
MDKIKSAIKNRKVIVLNEQQNRMIASGWGKNVLESTVTEKITYTSDKLKVKGYISYPLDKSKKYPCIIWNRGGLGNKGAIDSFTARGIFGQIASWGYVVIATQYRGNDGGEGQDEFGGDDVNDVLNLIPLAVEIENADTTKWGIEGWSRGGMMTYLALLKNPNFSVKDGYASGVRCAVLVGAISDFKSYVQSNENRIDIYKNLFSEKDFEKKLEERTVINFVDKLPNIPYLIMHGKSDDTVPVEQSIKIAEKLDELDYEYKLVLFDEGDHFLKKHRKEVDEMRKKWYEKYLS